jgi:phosphoglycolate phosphatase-like HAD superfamily hydrolase
MLIAFDIDGTLADLSHRLGLIRNDLGVKDWDGFFTRVRGDKPIPEMVELCNTFLKEDTTETEVIFVSGRNEVCREDTIEWLHNYTLAQLHTHEEEVTKGFVDYIQRPLLYMRAEGDRRPDYLVKQDILVEIEHDYGQKPDIVFDDRQQTVDMWREHGIRCCQVAKGDF